MEIPLGSREAQSWAPISDSQLSEGGVVLLTSKATTGLMLGSGKGKSGNFDNYWSDFVDRDHTRNPGLTREHVEYTIIYMCQRGL